MHFFLTQIKEENQQGMGKTYQTSNIFSCCRLVEAMWVPQSCTCGSFRDLPPSQGGEVRGACLSFLVLSPSSGNMAEELELLWQKLTVTDEEKVSGNLGRECTRATKERGNNCLVMKVLSRRGIMLDALRKNIRM